MNTALKLLPLFIAVAQSANFRAAADRLGITRSAVSQGMRKLEDSLGYRPRAALVPEHAPDQGRRAALPADCRTAGQGDSALEGVTADDHREGCYGSPFTGFYLYFPSRHNQPPKLRALVEHVRSRHLPD